MAFLLPIQDSPYFSQLLDLDGVIYSLVVRWNDREEAWYFDINEQDNTPIVAGLKIISVANLTGRWADSRLPPGDIFVFSDDINARPDRDSLLQGTTRLLYLTAEEVASVSPI